MGWLADNALANMPGPQFLVLYAIFAAAIAVCSFLFVDMQDRTGGMAPPPAPKDVNPYELAYLRGGANDVIRTAIYALHKKRMIEIAEGGIRATRSSGGVDGLNQIERRVYEAILPAPKIPQLFKAPLTQGIESLCSSYRQRLAAQQLLTPQEVRSAANLALTIGLLLLIAVAAYKTSAALAHGRSNFGFLFVEAVASGFLLLWLRQRTVSNNASKRGKAFLSQMRLAYAGHAVSTVRGESNRGADAALSGSALAMVGLFGFSILNGTPDAALAQEFSRSSQSSGGCGSGGGCGGGGGGGCGGCGGGGD